MTLAELLVGLPPQIRQIRQSMFAGASPEAVQVAEVRDDSRKVEPGDLFVAITGAAADGRAFLADAVARQASVLVVEDQLPGDRGSMGDRTPGSGREDLVPPGFRGTVIIVPNARHALAVIAANRFAAGRELTLSAVTGTNGKTTTTYLLESMLAAAGIRAGVVGTVAYRVGGGGPGQPQGDARGFCRAAPLTTPGALALHALLADMRGAGATDVVLEASSHALDQNRLDGCRFRVAGLTNVTQDHLDYHGSMDRYLDAKAILFSRLLDPSEGVAVLPVDLPEGRALRARVLHAARPGAGGSRFDVLGVAVAPGTSGADIQLESVEMSASGLRLRLATPGGSVALSSPLVGGFNLSNIVLAVGMAIARGLDSAAISAGLDRLQGVPGRLERVPNEVGALCLVDYAHTPDALERALAAVRPLVDEGRGGRLLTVFGCGGDRDRSKRPLMGAAAVAGSDLAIVTSDNPRNERPDEIIAMILDGVRGQGALELETAQDVARWAAAADRVPGVFHVAADRRTAIWRAVSACRAGDVALIAGKGHEDYQIIGGNRLPFDDRQEAAAAFVACSARPRASEALPP